MDTYSIAKAAAKLPEDRRFKELCRAAVSDRSWLLTSRDWLCLPEFNIRLAAMG